MTSSQDLFNKNRWGMNTFYECYVEGTDGGYHYRHPTPESAYVEAERLARLTGKAVYVFKCIGKCKVEEAPVKWEGRCR